VTWGDILGQVNSYGNYPTQLAPVSVTGDFLPNNGVRQVVNGDLHNL